MAIAAILIALDALDNWKYKTAFIIIIIGTALSIGILFVGVRLDKNAISKKIDKNGMDDTVVGLYVDNYSIKAITYFTDLTTLEVIKILRDHDVYKE